MRWRKLGLVWSPDGTRSWARSHATVPTPVLQEDGVIRVYISCLDERGRGRPAWVDVDSRDPTRVLATAKEPLLDVGQPGCFDDNGVMMTAMVATGPSTLIMYYAGFELCTHIRYRIFTGAAVSNDGGHTFVRHSEAPILDRSDEELYFRGGPFVLRDQDRFKLWYVAGSSWTDLGQRKAMPVYEMRYLESPDGLTWARSGRRSLSLTHADEHGFGRPWVVKRGTDYRLFYSIRRRSLAAYRLGYAESRDGVSWDRRDEELGLTVTPGSFDGQAIMYSAAIETGERTYCFYNGDNFGEKGFAVAVLE